MPGIVIVMAAWRWGRERDWALAQTMSVIVFWNVKTAGNGMPDPLPIGSTLAGLRCALLPY